MRTMRETPLDLFQSTPSARRATHPIVEDGAAHKISIHALREEGDLLQSGKMSQEQLFQSTPSARRATERWYDRVADLVISIHALREEGDHGA